jgi:hypothetical protein
MNPVVVAYPPGSCGTRLTKKLANVTSWNTGPKTNQHHFGSPAIQYDGYNKYLESKNIDNLLPIEIEQPIIAVHSLHGQTISKVFPRRQIVKVQASFYKSLRRWWYVFGKEWYQKLSPPPDLFFRPLQRHLTPCQHGIAFHAEYYETNVDTVADQCWKIEPGQSDFADFVLEEFEFPHDSEFDDAWNYIKEIADFTAMKSDQLICSK